MNRRVSPWIALLAVVLMLFVVWWVYSTTSVDVAPGGGWYPKPPTAIDHVPPPLAESERRGG